MSTDVTQAAPLTDEDMREISERATTVLLLIADGGAPDAADVANVTGDSARLGVEVYRLREQNEQMRLRLDNLRIDAEADAYYRALAQDDRATTGETVRCA